MKLAHKYHKQLGGIAGQIQDSLNKGQDGQAKEYLRTTNKETDSGIGYYVYVDGQYGVIYADLAYSQSISGGSYSYSAKNENELKKYYINGTYDPDNEGNGWKEKPLLVEDKTQGGTEDRFYVMALTNFTTGNYEEFYWDYNNNNEYSTSDDFGKGYENTKNLIMEWKHSDKNTHVQDIWNNLSEESKWFVPSVGEWTTFANALRITSNNRNSKGLMYYWSSSLKTQGSAWFAYKYKNDTTTFRVNDLCSVRLSRTY